MRWNLFGVEANTDTPSADGCVWTVASSAGWDAPDQRTLFTSPTGRDGQRVSNMYAEGRAVTIEGLIFAPDDASAWAAYDRVTSSMPGLRGYDYITAYEPVPKSLKAIQAGPPRVTKPAGRQLRYQLSLLAEYPWKRAVTASTVTVGAGATVAHDAAGTFPAEVEVTLTSAGTVDLTIGGQRLRTTSLPNGAVLTSGFGFIRPARTIRSALPANENLFGAIVQPMQWPAISPGANTIRQAGSAALSIRYFPTYA
ncbi:MAG: hypothetical protein HOQ27_10675 [Dermatophilaceae bacterium]|nr:hypothetical protein [Dermatophilaceae bacterium]